MPFFRKRKSNEEKFVDMLCTMDKRKLDKSLSEYGKFERMRQTWKKDGAGNLHLSEKEYITEDDLIQVENSVRSNCLELLNTEEYKTYMEFLRGILELEIRSSLLPPQDEKFKKSVAINRKMAEYFNASLVFTNNFKNIVQDKSDFASIKETLKAVEIMMKTNISNNTLQECKEYLGFMLQQFKKRGGNSTVRLSPKINAVGQIAKLRKKLDTWMEEFYMALAKKVFDKYKNVYDLAMKCDAGKVRALFNDDYKSVQYNGYIRVKGILTGLAVDAGQQQVAEKLRKI